MTTDIDKIIHPKEESLEERFSKERLQWSSRITEMSSKLKRLAEFTDLTIDLYTERQRAVEYYHYLVSLSHQISKKYNALYAERYEYYTNKSQIRYPNESAKHNRILVDLQDHVEKKSAIENHYKFMAEVVKTIDHIIWGTQKRLDIEKIIRGD